MSTAVTVKQAAAMLKDADRIWILTHHFPDGDTLGSGFALSYALQSLGKRVCVKCHHAIPEKYEYIVNAVKNPDFEPDFICAVDVADSKLLGETLEPYADRVELCIDHHGSHRSFEKHLLLDATCGANAMIVMQVIEELGVAIDQTLANCLYTGMATDTGCFKYNNTTPQTHRMAAQLMEAGAQADMINRTMFDIKSRSRVALEQMALQSMTFYDKGRIAVMCIRSEMIEKSGATENDMEGLSPLPRQIEGVWVGVTLRQKADGAYKISLRTGTHVNAAAVCAELGGGGHPSAAGCALSGDEQDVIERVLETIRRVVPRITV